MISFSGGFETIDVLCSVEIVVDRVEIPESLR